MIRTAKYAEGGIRSALFAYFAYSAVGLHFLLVKTELLFKEESYLIVGACFEVYRAKGPSGLGRLKAGLQTNQGPWKASTTSMPRVGTMNPPLTPPKRGTGRTRTKSCAPPGRGRGVGRFMERDTPACKSKTSGALMVPWAPPFNLEKPTRNAEAARGVFLNTNAPITSNKAQP